MAKDKDHITLNECTKADLLWIINRMSVMHGAYYLECALNELWYEKEKQRLAEASKYRKIVAEKMRAYSDLLQPYDGKPYSSIPDSVIHKAANLAKESDAAQKKFMSLMGI